MPITRCGRVARGYRRKRFYSTPSRILTHLSATAAHEPVTLSVLTQEGIAASTHSGRTTATKWLARLEASGLVAGERAHVPGHRVRKTVYRLSHEGWVEAMKVRARLKTDIVEVVAPALDPTPMRVSDIPEIFPAYVNLTAAVSLIRRGRLDFTKLQGIGSGAVAPILWGDTLRRLGRVFGRSDESRALDSWAASPSAVLVVTGIAGIGKSALVTSWLVRQRPRPYIYWFEIHDGTTRPAFLRDLAAFLARLGRRGLTNLLREGHPHTQAVTVGVLNHDLKGLPILLVLDNFQRANPDLARFLRGPILELCQSGPTKVVLISRTVPPNLARRKAPKRPRIEVLRIGGLDLDASLSLLRAKGFAGDEVALQRVANTARGHPILLSFAAQTGSMVSGEMTRYLEREIWRTLTKDERTLLEAASLFRGLVPLDAMHCFTPEWQAAVHSLQAKNLLAPTISGGVVVHDSIREYIRDRLPEPRRHAFHSLASAYFLDGSEMHDRLEGLFHLVESGDLKAFGEHLISRGVGLPDSVPAAELLSVLRKIDPAGLDPVPRCVLPEVIGDALRELALLEEAHGALADAALHMNQAVDLAAEVSEPGALARSLAALGTIEVARGNLEIGLQSKLEALRIAERGGNLTEIARACTAVGVSLHELRHFEDSLKYYDRALQIARLVGNIRLQGYALMNRAAAMMDIGLFDAAGPVIDEAKRLIHVLEERGALLLIDISDGQREMGLGRWNRATRLWDRGLRGLKELGGVSDYARALTYVGRFYLERGELQRGLKILAEARSIAQDVGNPSLISHIEALVSEALPPDLRPPTARSEDA